MIGFKWVNDVYLTHPNFDAIYQEIQDCQCRDHINFITLIATCLEGKSYAFLILLFEIP